MTDDGAPMKVLYEQFIPNSMILDVWGLYASGAYFCDYPTYVRWRGEVRGFAAGGGSADVPRWARVVLWFKGLFTRRVVAVRGRKVEMTDYDADDESASEQRPAAGED